VVAWFQAGAVSDPLAEIAETVAHLTHQPDLASIRPVPVFSRDEIGGLAQSVNHMVARLAESRHKIEELATTAQRRAAELETVLGNMVDAVVVSDMRGRLIGANRAGLRLFGLRSTEELGADVRELFDRLPATHADGRKLSPDELPITRGLAGQPVHPSDVVVLQQQGERPRQLSWSSSPIRDDDGRVLGVVAVIRDVTELVELDQLKDQFIRAAAHELKTPVTIMKARAQGLLRGAEVDPRRRKMLESIDRGADRIAHIVRDLLELSEMQLGRLSIVPERVDLRAVIEDGVAHAARLSAGERIHVHADGGAIVDGDRTRLAGVIGRLLENAAKYSPNGGEIDVDLHLENGRAVVSVTDHGIGIPQEKQAHLFECFYRAHAATQEDFGGLGVGLFLSRKIVDLHHGSMWFKSEQGHGSTFAFSLPLHAESTPAQ